MITASNQDINNSEISTKPSVILQFLSQLFSYLFHPLFIPLYVAFFLIYIHPSAFVGFSDAAKKSTLIIIVLNLLFFPLMSVLLLKAVGFIDSIFLKTQKDRIIPYMACGIFFFWAYTVFKEQSQYPSVLVVYIFGLFLSSSAALLANIYFKVSMHAIGLGGWLGIFLLLAYNGSMLMSWPLSLLLLIIGLVCASRLFLKSHTAIDIYAGLFIGMLTQIIAIKAVG